MNWGRAKTILILMFLVTDVFLAIILIQSRANVSSLSEETIAATVHVLEEQGLSLDEALVPQKRVPNRNVIMRNYFDDPMAAAEKMLDEFVVQKADEEQKEYQFEDDEAFLMVTNASFYYSKKKAKEPYKTGDEPSVENMASRVIGELDKLGFDKKEMTVTDGRWEHGIYHCRVVPLFDEAKIYGITMLVTADSQDIVNMEGSWFCPEGTEDYGSESLMDITSILAGLIYREDCQNMQITGLETAFYASGDYLQSREIAAVPVYIITDATGKQLYFDGRTGDVIARQ